MKIHRLVLRNWRGVSESSVVFADGVTVVEGPNEIGKSSIVEAINLLFSELDSSKKKDIQAIKPVDQDVGSEVSAEISAGPYHFQYSKTYNKTPATLLSITAPQAEQLTGREAHEKVQQLLAERVDMALWRALLIKQGDSPQGADLKNSGSLLKALDEAAGSTGQGDENPDLFAAVQAQYEQYFSLKTGKIRYQGLLDQRDAAHLQLATATEHLAEVELQIEQQDRCAAEVRRLQALLPNQTEEKAKHEQHWRSLQTKQQSLETQRSLANAARQLSQQLQETIRNRQTAADEITQAQAVMQQLETMLHSAQAELAPLMQRVDTLRVGLAELSAQQTLARESLKTAEADRTHLQSLDRLSATRARLKQIAQVQAQLTEKIAEQEGITVTDALVQEFQQTELDCQVARSQLDGAATQLEVQALSDTSITIDGNDLPLNKGHQHVQPIDRQLTLQLANMARITLTPPPTTQDVRDKLTDAEFQLAELQTQCQVATAAEAAVINLHRRHTLQTIAQLKSQEQSLLGKDSLVEISQRAASDQSATESYAVNRQTEDALPANSEDAAARAQRCQETWNRGEEALDAIRDSLLTADEELTQHQRNQAVQQQQLELEQSLINAKRDRLQAEREAESDDVLANRATQAIAELKQQAATVAQFEKALASQSADTARSLMDNASRVEEQTRHQLAEREQALAVANDRLATARADGRFETFETAQRERNRVDSEVEALLRRGQAAKLLWETLNGCREASRLAYVQPLKLAIEQLGQIVFGSGFAVHVDDNWRVSERVLDGKTLPVSSLSIGAQEQLGLLSRLAAAQIVSSQEGVPLIIDDALGFSDPQRLRTLGAAIAAAGKKCQIIILTCTPGRFQNVGGARFISLNQ